ncbi:MAG: hypothetical protein ABW056_06540, partial [Thermoanaerobaculia bacterium]
AELLARIKADLPTLVQLFDGSNDKWHYEDPIYRFYHHSYKVFGLQHRTEEIVAALQGLRPGGELDPMFLEIVANGTGKEFSIEQNADWPRHTRPIQEAFFHARFFLEMAIRYADLPEAPTQLPSGWAAMLCLYRLR